MLRRYSFDLAMYAGERLKAAGDFFLDVARWIAGDGTTWEAIRKKRRAAGMLARAGRAQRNWHPPGTGGVG